MVFRRLPLQWFFRSRIEIDLNQASEDLLIFPRSAKQRAKLDLRISIVLIPFAL
jgi:hypothetical protein